MCPRFPSSTQFRCQVDPTTLNRQFVDSGTQYRCRTRTLPFAHDRSEMISPPRRLQCPISHIPAAVPRTAIFYHNEEQRKVAVRSLGVGWGCGGDIMRPPLQAITTHCTDGQALSHPLSQEASKARLEQSGVYGKGRPLVTQIVPAAKFWCGRNSEGRSAL